MQCETLFSIGQARAMMAVAGMMFAALALRLAWRVAAGEACRLGAAKTALLLLLSAPLAFWAGGKGGLNCGIMELCNYGNAGLNISTNTPSTILQSPAPTVSQSSVSPNGHGAAPGLHRYFAPSNFVADLSIFTRPTNAVTPSLWTRHSVSDDFRWALPGYKAGVCGAVTTQPWGIDTPQRIKDCYETYAPFYATNSLIRGVGDFWAVTNENSKTFVWKDLAYNRDPSNLVSFAATVYDWGDFEFTYGNIPEGGFSSFVKLGPETLDLTQYAASGRTVRVEKNLEQDAEWWLENYPEICHTNATGELVFEYDTNEWCFVLFVIENEAYNEDMLKYLDAFRVARNEVPTQEKYVVVVSSSGDNGNPANGEERDYTGEFFDIINKKYGDQVAFNNRTVPSLPQGVPKEDVYFFGVENGTVTNITKWSICSNARIEEKIGAIPSPEDYGMNSDMQWPSGTWRVGNIEIDLNIFFSVRPHDKIKVYEAGNEVKCWDRKNVKGGFFILPCRSGFRYKASCDHVFEFCRFLNDEKNLDVYETEGRRAVYFNRKLSMNIDGVAFTNANFATARAAMTPPVTNGVYRWEASDNIRVRQMDNGQYAGLFLESGGGGFVKCIWENGRYGEWRLCTTGEVSVASCGDGVYTNLTKFLDLRAAPSLAVYENTHLGTNGQPVAATVPTSSLVCSYGGNRAGRLELSQTSGSTVALSDGGVPITLPYTWDVAGGGTEPDRVFHVSNLHAGEVATFRLKFTNDILPQGIDCYASIRAVELVVQADRTWPTERYRHVFGPHETVNLAVHDYSGAIAWDFGSAPIPLSPFTYTLPNTPGLVNVTLTVDGSSYSFPLAVVVPSIVATNAVPMTDADWMEIGSAPPAVGEIGAGERIYLKLEPDYVSFAGLKTMEGFSPVYNKTGCFEQVIMTNTQHDAAAGAFVVTAVGKENQAGDDRAGFIFTLQGLPPPWSDGGFEFRIPHYWWVDGTTQTNELATCVQRFTLFPNGDSEISKFGWTVHRGTNGVSNVTGPDASTGQN